MLVPFFVQKPVKKRFYMYSLLEKYTEGESQMKDKIFSVLQRVGRSFMLPIAILPVAGLLLGIGSSFTNATTIADIRTDKDPGRRNTASFPAGDHEQCRKCSI